jgi:hypothetical protein
MAVGVRLHAGREQRIAAALLFEAWDARIAADCTPLHAVRVLRLVVGLGRSAGLEHVRPQPRARRTRMRFLAPEGSVHCKGHRAHDFISESWNDEVVRIAHRG